MRTQLEIRDEVAWLTMDDGKVNALSESLLREVEARFAETRDRARVTVLQGRPGIFSAGFDLGAFAGGAEGADGAIRMMVAGVDLIRTLLIHPHPVVTGCAGHAYPMGAFLMLSADRRLGVTGPFRIGMNEVAIGLTVPRFALALAERRLTAWGYAAVSTGTLLSPEEAISAGYLDRVVPEAELPGALEAQAQALLGIDATAYRRTKERMHADLLATLDDVGSTDGVAAEIAAALGG